MRPHPDFADATIPEALALGPYRLTMLTAADIDDDFAAVTASAGVLRGMFGPDWPDGLTRADDLTDLHWHHREFTARRSFAWIIRDAAGLYLGCAYLFPEIGARGRFHATFWFIDTPERVRHCADFAPLYAAWWRALLPPGHDLRLTSNAALGPGHG